MEAGLCGEKGSYKAARLPPTGAREVLGARWEGAGGQKSGGAALITRAWRGETVFQS